MAKRLAELGALQDAVSNSESNPSRLGLAGYIRGLFLDWSANPYNPLTRLSARGRLLGYFWDNGAVVLSMDFANQSFIVKDGTLQSKPFSDIVNFSRTSNATVTNSAGVITYAPHNLLTYSEQFDNSAWTKDTSAITANSIIAPNETQTADKLTTTTASAQHSLLVNVSVTSGVTYTHTYYAKKGEINFFFIGWSTPFFGAFNPAYFNLETGEITTGAGTTATITDVGNGWWRCSATRTAISTGSVQLRVGLTDSNSSTTSTGANTTDGIYIWGAQLEIGSTATTYNSTTVKNLLGYSELFDNAAWTKSNSFVQTNLLTYSEAFDNTTGWTLNDGTVSANSVIAPNGYQTADVFTESATTTFHGYVAAGTNRPTSNVTSTLSVYIKAGTRRYVVIGVAAGTVGYFVTVDTQTMTITEAAAGSGGGTYVSSSITPSTNGFYRVVITGLIAAGASTTIIRGSSASTGNNGFAPSYLGDGSTIIVWGAQLVQGSVAGDYRRTDAAALPVYYPNHNGVVCAEKLVENTASTFHYINSGSTAAGTYTYSIYTKAGERNFVLLTNGSAGCYFNLSTGVAGTPGAGITANIVSAGNGYYRCSITFTSAISFICYTYIASTISTINYTGDGTSGIYIFGAQLSDSASLDPYVLNAAAAPTAAAYYGARFDYDPVTLAPKGLLIEEQRANLLLNSSLAGTNLATQSVTVTAVAHTLSFYGTGTVTLTGTANTSLVGTGAYPTRSTLTFTPTAGVVLFTVTGTVQYAQLEIGSFATSFIPTAASQVTRTADIASIQGSNFYSWYNQNEGSVYANYIVPPNLAGFPSTMGVISDGTTQNFILMYAHTTGLWSNITSLNTVQFQAQVLGAPTVGANAKQIVTYKINDAIGSVGGQLTTQDTSVNLPIVNQFKLGTNGSGSAYINGIIKQISYYPTRLNNDTLKGLTV